MCFAPQRRELFEHLTSTELPKVVRESCVPTFLFPNVLRAPTCSFWTFPLPKLLRTWRGFSFLTSKSASRHNGMQFFISNLTRRLRTRFSVLRLWHLFAHLYLFSAHSLFFDSFSSLTLLTSALPSVNIVGSLTSKLPLSIVRISVCMYICISPCFLMIAGFISVLGDYIHGSLITQVYGAKLPMNYRIWSISPSNFDVNSQRVPGF